MQISYDITKLVHFMSKASGDTFVMNDFRRQQFVLVNGSLKLSDVDDVGFDEPSCISDDECQMPFCRVISYVCFL